nr:MAG TPA: hypothetical protein [Bacteriophage sp.]
MFCLSCNFSCFHFYSLLSLLIKNLPKLFHC